MGQPPSAAPYSVRATWLFSVPLNLALGVFALAPLIVTLFAVHAVAHHLGWARYSPVDPDEHEAVMLIIVLGWLSFVPVAYLLNRLLLRQSTVPGHRFWLVAAVAMVVPYLAWCLRTNAVVW
jgi:hypothetical protein